MQRLKLRAVHLIAFAPVSKPASSAATTRVRSTTRARRLLVPNARTDEALVRIAGATIAVSTAKGFSAAEVYCTHFTFLAFLPLASLFPSHVLHGFVFLSYYCFPVRWRIKSASA